MMLFVYQQRGRYGQTDMIISPAQIAGSLFKIQPEEDFISLS